MKSPDWRAPSLKRLSMIVAVWAASTGVIALLGHADTLPVPWVVSRFEIGGYSMTESARAWMDGGIVSPSAFAVLRWMTSSNFVGCSIGRSPGLAPLRILSTYNADPRIRSSEFAPYYL